MVYAKFDPLSLLYTKSVRNANADRKGFMQVGYCSRQAELSCNTEGIHAVK